MGKPAIRPVGSNSSPDIGADGIDGANVGAIDAVDTSSIPDAEPPKRRGGWPAGKPRTSAGNRGGNGNAGTGTGTGTARAQKEKASLDLSGIAGALAGIHLGIAMITKQDHWKVEDSEAEAMAKSVIQVARHYPKVAGSQKIVDWSLLIGALGMVYVPRIMLTRELMAEKKEQARKERANG